MRGEDQGHWLFVIGELHPFSVQGVGMKILFQNASSSLLDVCANPKWFGAVPGITAVLHTWTRQLEYHPHIHFLVTGGGLAPDGSWREPDDKFLVPVHALSDVFRARFRVILKTRYPELFETIPAKTWSSEWVEKGLSAQRIFQDLRADHGFTGGYDSVKRYVRRLTAGQPERVYRMECEPGAEAQVDFGLGAPVLVDGRKRRTWVFRIVLSHSRKAYSEAVRHQTTEEFIRCLENAFRHFGGVPRMLVIDNLRAAVQQADWYEPELTPKMAEFCRHYGIVVLPTRPFIPDEEHLLMNEHELAKQCQYGYRQRKSQYGLLSIHLYGLRTMQIRLSRGQRR